MLCQRCVRGKLRRVLVDQVAADFVAAEVAITMLAICSALPLSSWTGVTILCFVRDLAVPALTEATNDCLNNPNLCFPRHHVQPQRAWKLLLQWVRANIWQRDVRRTSTVVRWSRDCRAGSSRRLVPRISRKNTRDGRFYFRALRQPYSSTMYQNMAIVLV